MKKWNMSAGAGNRISRRNFIKSTAAVGTLAFFGSTANVLGANSRLRIAVCGVRSRGNHLMRTFLNEDNVEVAWIIDPDHRLLERRSGEVEEITGRKPRTATDVRRALEDPDVDAIVVATPNHWHSTMVVWAAQAGKHCFVEKPASHDVWEGRVALEASRKYGVVVQHGTQRRNRHKEADLMKTIQSGKYGRLALSHAYASKPREGIGHAEPASPPDWLDWNMWRGHAMLDEYHGNLVHYDWHWFWATGNGDLNNQGTHELDIARWALDPEMHDRHPTRVMSLGGRYVWDDQGETPNSQFGVAEYPNGQKVLMEVRNVNHEDYVRRVENRFFFEDGGMIIGEQYLYVAPNGREERVEVEEADVFPGGNAGSFVRACRSGNPEQVNAGMHEGHYTSALGHLMNNSYRLGVKKPFSRDEFHSDDNAVIEQFEWFHGRLRDGVGLNPEEEQYQVGPWLTFDSDSERFTGEMAEEANLLLRNPRREEFDLPEPDQV